MLGSSLSKTTLWGETFLGYTSLRRTLLLLLLVGLSGKNFHLVLLPLALKLILGRLHESVTTFVKLTGAVFKLTQIKMGLRFPNRTETQPVPPNTCVLWDCLAHRLSLALYKFRLMSEHSLLLASILRRFRQRKVVLFTQKPGYSSWWDQDFQFLYSCWLQKEYILVSIQIARKGCTLSVLTSP